MRFSKKTAVGMALMGGTLFACQEGAPPAPTEAPKQDAAAPAAAAAPEDTEPAGEPGNIKVTVKLNGKAPEMTLINRKADPFCNKTKRKDESVVVSKDGGLGNVAVIVQKVKGKHATPEKAITIDQSECMYSPRVSTAMYDQNIEILNSDMTLHNVHTYKGSNQANWFNKAQPPKSKPIAQKLPNKKEGQVQFKCDVHPWMGGFVILNDSPFHGVTGEDGSVQIDGVPSKSKAYKLNVWHEKYGEKEVEVTVEAGKTAEVSVSFDAAGS